MAYATQDKLRIAIGGTAALIEFSDLENTGALDVTVIEDALASADGVINSYIGHRYRVPLEVVPDSISDLGARWAARLLRGNRFKGQGVADDQKSEETDREWLKGVADGTISLGIEPTPEKASIVIDKAAPRDSTLSVSAQRLKGFI